MYLEDKLIELMESNKFCEFPIAFRKRVDYCFNLIRGGTLTERGVDLPYYLNDLGVRKLSSPRLLYEKIFKTNSIEMWQYDKIAEDLEIVEITKLADLLEGVFLVIGDYELLRSIINKRYSEILNSKDYWLLSYSATVLAVFGDASSFNLYKKAMEIEEMSLYDRLVAGIRICVASVKRLDDKRRFEKTLSSIVGLMDGLSSIERLTVLLLLNNLYGLYAVKFCEDGGNKYSSGITYLTNETALTISDVLLTKFDLDLLRFDMIARYRNQVVLNKSQLMVFSGDVSTAIEFLENNLEFTQQNCQSYIPELLGALGYVCFLDKQYAKALKYLAEGAELYYKIGDEFAYRE